MSEYVIHKFGGSCLRESNDIEKISSIIKTQTGGKPAIVVSALWGVTDKLLRSLNDTQYAGKIVQDLITQHLLFAPGLDKGLFGDKFNKVILGISKELVKLSTEEISLKSRNLILAAGERLSALAVAHKLRDLGIDANPIGAEDIGLRLKGIGKSKQIDIDESKNNLRYEMLIGIPVLTGWFGQGSDGELAILTRGGSDHSAAAFANLLNAEKVILWKDVDGIKMLNPRWGIDSPSIRYLGYGQAEELSLHGTTVIHPSTVTPLIDLGIPLEIRNINKLNERVPTVIGPDVDNKSVIAIGCQPGVAVITTNNSVSTELLELIEQENVLPWHLESNNNSTRLILPHRFATNYEQIIDGKITPKEAILTIIGDVKIENPKFEFVSKNKYGVRYLVTSDNLVKEISELYYSLFSLQDCK